MFGIYQNQNTEECGKSKMWPFWTTVADLRGEIRKVNIYNWPIVYGEKKER